MEAAFGKAHRTAMESILQRMKTGVNRSFTSDGLTGQVTDWLTNSIGTIMFFNTRSALLQTISAVNYINWSDNNILRASQAFANQPQYWKDFAFLFNSDFLKQRRAGNQRGINEAELSDAVAGADNKAKAAIAWLLKKGFVKYVRGKEVWNEEALDEGWENGWTPKNGSKTKNNAGKGHVYFVKSNK